MPKVKQVKESERVYHLKIAADPPSSFRITLETLYLLL
jgi:hypothetical protein